MSDIVRLHGSRLSRYREQEYDRSRTPFQEHRDAFRSPLRSNELPEGTRDLISSLQK